MKAFDFLGPVLLLVASFGCAGELLDPAPSTESKPGAVEASATTGEPCDVRAVFDAYCANCHGQQTYYDYQRAPALTFSRAELESKDETGATLAERVALRLSDPEDPMAPLIYVSRPSDAERTLLTEWIGAGMPEGSCGK